MNREMLKANFTELENIVTDQKNKLPQPPLEKPLEESAQVIELPPVSRDTVVKKDIFDCLSDRKSNRVFKEENLSLQELSFLLWATQGVKKVVGKVNFAAFRTVPSGGARHPFETYLVINRVEGLKKGIYRYLSLEHKLAFLCPKEDLEKELTVAAFGQSFPAKSAVVFIWSCVPYRTEWRYDIAANKIILQDSGHLCQNLYLASEAIGCGTCAIGAYDQQAADKFLKLDGENEFVVYMAPVGKV